MNISISLTPELLDRADRQEAEHIKSLRRAWRDGAASADAGTLDFDQLRSAAKRKLRQRSKK